MIKVIALMLPVLGIVAGGAAGYFLRAPAAEDEATTAAPEDLAAEVESAPEEEAPASVRSEAGYPGVDTDFVDFSNQFVIPLLRDDEVHAMMILSLAVEAAANATEDIYAIEPRLRDALLRVLFDHASVGGFDGNFMSGSRMEDLRRALREVAIGTGGSQIKDILIVDLVKQSI